MSDTGKTCQGGAYQSSSIGAVEAEERDGSLDLLVGGSGSVGAGLGLDGALGGGGPRGAEHCLSREHGDCGIGCGDADLECREPELQFLETGFGCSAKEGCLRQKASFGLLAGGCDGAKSKAAGWNRANHPPSPM